MTANTELPSDAVVAEAIAPPPPSAFVMVEDELSHLEAYLEAMQVAMARSEWKAVAARASHAEAQAQFLGEIPVHPSGDVLI